MKRWLVASLLVVLAGVLVVGVINSKRDPIAILKGHGGKIERNEQGEVVEVDLRFKDITDAGLVHLKGMTNLQKLNLGGTKITDAGLVHLMGLTNLQALDLRRSRTLRALGLAAGQVTAAGVADLRKALPNCKISK